jgi:hypothetical protein
MHIMRHLGAFALAVAACSALLACNKGETTAQQTAPNEPSAPTVGRLPPVGGGPSPTTPPEIMHDGGGMMEQMGERSDGGHGMMMDTGRSDGGSGVGGPMMRDGGARHGKKDAGSMMGER